MPSHDPRSRRRGEVDVLVVNQAVPAVRSRSEARLSFLRTADLVSGLARSYRADLLVFPEYGLQGTALHDAGDAPLAFPEEALDILAPVCRAARVWVAVSVSGGATRPDRRHQVVLLDDRGDVVLRHRTGPVDRSGDGPRVVSGPKGLRTALAYADGHRSALTDPDLWDAELVIQHWINPGATAGRIVQTARGLAWTNTCFVVSANAAGSIGPYHWAGHSSLVNHDGVLLGLCGEEQQELQYAELSVDDVRRARSARARAAQVAAAALRGRSTRRPAAMVSANTPGKGETYVR
ncbi:nitrilase-related carbon-nitrogen hydrolase [Pseudonocardia sp. WMMC193]|uniref:nitrilase-related carbon-nitrogen hydrolase n=1 Tax=Pseudonocardia sp. WMMC193 TaxID=2911965 RepID=UPI001F298C39|nr:nitrilase-related carbon-nitrogen hydrolase [Pseudonocardia sp. WMMC193]MCF7547495.1 hypothetical protein [Pseudonocardia sp. WMMC193]